MTSHQPVRLSVIIPVYNEIENLDPLQAEIETALDPCGFRYEVIYANDGSRDGSREKLEEMARTHPGKVVVVDLRRNFGQTAAIAAGIDHARGEIVVLLDADLQNDPADIRMLLDKLDEGYDVVSGWSKDRKDKFLTRRLPSMSANWLISLITGIRLHDYGCTLKAYRREVLREVRLYGEMRTFKVVLDLITVKFLLSYRTTPMYLFGGVGFGFIGLSILTLVVALLNKFLRDASLIRTPLPQLAATFFVVGVQSILLGLTTELLVRTYHESQDKPVYVVRRVIGQDETSALPSHIPHLALSAAGSHHPAAGPVAAACRADETAPVLDRGSQPRPGTQCPLRRVVHRQRQHSQVALPGHPDAGSARWPGRPLAGPLAVRADGRTISGGHRAAGLCSGRPANWLGGGTILCGDAARCLPRAADSVRSPAGDVHYLGHRPDDLAGPPAALVDRVAAGSDSGSGLPD